MRCPHCGNYDTGVICRHWENKHRGCYIPNCCRETWRCWGGCKNTWEQYTCEG